MSRKDEKQEPMVLVGFGKHELKDLLKLRGTPEEDTLLLAPVNWPARYKRESICDPDEIQDFLVFGTWMHERMKEKMEDDQ